MGALATARQAWAGFRADKVPRLAAALAFYTLLALAPLVVLVVALAALATGGTAAREALVGQVAGLTGEQGGQVVADILANAQHPSGRGWAAALGLAALVVGATGVVAQLQDTLNTIWGVAAAKGAWLRVLLRKRLLSLGFVAALGFLLVVSLLASAALAAFAARTGNGPSALLLEGVHALAALALFTLLLAACYKVLPDCRVRWRDAWPGALVTAGLFVAGKSLLGAYLGRGALASVYGAAGSLAVLLAWVYWSGLVFFLGAELTQATAQARGQPLVPERGAAAVAPVGQAVAPVALPRPAGVALAALGTGILLGLAVRLSRWARRGRNRDRAGRVQPATTR